MRALGRGRRGFAGWRGASGGVALGWARYGLFGEGSGNWRAWQVGVGVRIEAAISWMVGRFGKCEVWRRKGGMLL